MAKIRSRADVLRSGYRKGRQPRYPLYTFDQSPESKQLAADISAIAGPLALAQSASELNAAQEKIIEKRYNRKKNQKIDNFEDIDISNIQII